MPQCSSRGTHHSMLLAPISYFCALCVHNIRVPARLSGSFYHADAHWSSPAIRRLLPHFRRVQHVKHFPHKKRSERPAFRLIRSCSTPYSLSRDTHRAPPPPASLIYNRHFSPISRHFPPHPAKSRFATHSAPSHLRHKARFSAAKLLNFFLELTKIHSNLRIVPLETHSRSKLKSSCRREGCGRSLARVPLGGE